MNRSRPFEYFLEYLLLPALVVSLVAIGMGAALDLRLFDSKPNREAAVRSARVEIQASLTHPAGLGEEPKRL